jgi:predicted lipid carrier protein YhbT
MSPTLAVPAASFPVGRLAALALRPLPPEALQPLLSFLVAAVRQRHEALFDRLGAYQDARFLIDPTDLPFVFMLRPRRRNPSLCALRRGWIARTRPTAVIRGGLVDLLRLLQGDSDGDALFFSRRLSFEGDTQAILALRNALDDAEIDLAADVAAMLGPAGRLMLPVHRRCVSLASSLHGLLETARRSPPPRPDPSGTGAAS